MLPHTLTTPSLAQIHTHTLTTLTTPSPPLPSPTVLKTSHSALLTQLPISGHGLPETTTHLLTHIAPSLPASALSRNYYGFVTGGVTPAALAAETLAAVHDANVQVHLPGESVATAVEGRALGMLGELFGLGDGAEGGAGKAGKAGKAGNFKGRTLTTGATAANILGLACGREFIIAEAGRRVGKVLSAGDMGVLEACAEVGVTRLRVLGTRAHSCLGKAASVVGLGRGAVVDVGDAEDDLGVRFDWERLERELGRERALCVVAVSCSEVNTGAFATDRKDMERLRGLCDRFGAWLHVDAAFGIFARCLPDTPEFASVRAGAEGLELADSIAGDAHKMLNVPYDCGFFFTRHELILPAVFQNANAVYLGGAASDVPSPLNIGLENSRRFRGLPVYATLVAYGRDGYQDMVERQVRLARKVASWIDGQDGLELLPASRRGEAVGKIFIIVLFRAKDEAVNVQLVKRINVAREIYVSGTQWEGKPASRIAVSNWQVDVEKDFELVTRNIDQALRG